MNKNQIVFIFMTFFTFSFALNANFLEFRIELTKPVYLEHEPIWVKLILKNVTEQTVMVSRDLKGSTSLLEWELTDAAGNRFEYRWIVPHKEIPSYPLSPGDSISYYFDLLYAFGKKEPPISPRCYLKSGEYHLNAIYDPYQYSIKAKSLSFRVETPKAEEAVALELFREAYLAWLIQKDDKKADTIYKKLITQYPNSVYFELAYNSMLINNKYGLRNYRELLELSEKFINDHPTSPYMKNMIYHLVAAYRGLGRTDESKIKIRELVSRFGDTNPLIRRVALQQIEEMKQKIKKE